MPAGPVGWALQFQERPSSRQALQQIFLHPAAHHADGGVSGAPQALITCAEGLHCFVPV